MPIFSPCFFFENGDESNENNNYSLRPTASQLICDLVELKLKNGWENCTFSDLEYLIDDVQFKW